MSAYSLFGGRRSKVGVFLHDSYAWHGMVFSYKRGRWHSAAVTYVRGGNPLQLPEELLEWAAALGTRRARVLIPCEPREVEMAFSEEMDTDEMHAAMTVEVAEDDPLRVRVAMARADSFRLGGDSGRFLVASFAESSITDYQHQCERKHLRFEGAGPLELALLNYHARQAPERRCLLLLSHGCLYASPAAQGQPFVCASSPVTFREEDMERNPDRYERLRRRALTHRDVPLTVYAACPLSEEQAAAILPWAGGDEETRILNLREHAARMVLHTAWARETGGVLNGGAMTGARKAPRDPHRAGTWACLLIVLASAGVMGWLSYSSHLRLSAAQERQTAWDALKQKRTQLESEAAQKREERDRSRRVTAELRDARVLPAGLFEVLDALRVKMPPHTRLTRLYQPQISVLTSASPARESISGPASADATVPDLAAKELILEGTTFSQQSLTELGAILSAALEDSGLQVTPGRFERLERPNELSFEYRVFPRPGARP